MVVTTGTWNCIPSADRITVHSESATEFISGFPSDIPVVRTISGRIYVCPAVHVNVRPDILRMQNPGTKQSINNLNECPQDYTLCVLAGLGAHSFGRIVAGSARMVGNSTGTVSLSLGFCIIFVSVHSLKSPKASNVRKSSPLAHGLGTNL